MGEAVADEQLASIVYVSSETARPSEQALLDLLAAARTKNTRMGVTGLLLHKPGRFIQVLEGPPAALAALMRSIEADVRHTAVRVMLQTAVSARQFPSWSMGFREAPRGASAARPGHREFDDALIVPRGEHSRTAWLLDWFRVTGDNRPAGSASPPVR